MYKRRDAASPGDETFGKIWRGIRFGVVWLPSSLGRLNPLKGLRERVIRKDIGQEGVVISLLVIVLLGCSCWEDVPQRMFKDVELCVGLMVVEK